MFVPCSGQLLWRISGNGLEKPSYLFGSLHVAPPKFIDSVCGLRDVMAEVDQLYVETVSNSGGGGDDDGGADVGGERADHGGAGGGESDVLCMPEGRVLGDLFSAEERSRINHFIFRLSEFEDMDYLGEHSYVAPGLAVSRLDIDIADLNSELVFGSVGGVTFDDVFERYALDAGKVVGALDDAVEHAAGNADSYYLGSLSLENRGRFFLEWIDNYGLVNMKMYGMLSDYASQDLERVNPRSGMKKREREYIEDGSRSVHGRNLLWMEKMPGIMSAGGTLFVVGVHHLGNVKERRGLISLLRKAGYRVEPYCGE